MIVLVLFAGCASQEERLSYYQAVNDRNKIILEMVEREREDTRNARQMENARFAAAMTSAAKTPSGTDDAVISFAWGYSSGKPDSVKLPELQGVEPPVTDVDRVRAWTPLAGLVFPFLQWLFYPPGDEQSAIVADNGSTILLDSGNSGSYNKAEDDLGISMSNYQDFSNYQDYRKDYNKDNGAGVDPALIFPQE